MKTSKTVLFGALIAAVVFVSTAAYAEGKPPAQGESGASASATAVAGAGATAINYAPIHVQVSAPIKATAPAPAAPATLKADQSINFERPVASAVAPGLVATNGSCAGSAAFGVQGPGFGISGGKTFDNGKCDTRYDVATIALVLGELDSAIARACMDNDIREARELAGRECPKRKQEPVAGYTGNDEIVIKRLRRQEN